MILKEQIRINAVPAGIFLAVLSPLMRGQWSNGFINSTFDFDKLLQGQINFLEFTETYKEEDSMKEYKVDLAVASTIQHFSFIYKENGLHVKQSYLLKAHKEYSAVEMEVSMVYRSLMALLRSKKSVRASKQVIRDDLKNLKEFVEGSPLLLPFQL